MKTKTEAELRQWLNEEFSVELVAIKEEPDPSVPGSEGSASWRDYDGITYGNTVAEQRVIDCWLLEVIGKKIGYEIERVREIISSGRCNLWFKRKVV